MIFPVFFLSIVGERSHCVRAAVFGALFQKLYSQRKSGRQKPAERRANTARCNLSVKMHRRVYRDFAIGSYSCYIFMHKHSCERW